MRLIFTKSEDLIHLLAVEHFVHDTDELELLTFDPKMVSQVDLMCTTRVIS